jgi:hypothetical protein
MTDAVITETVSKKPKRGRPSSVLTKEDALIKGFVKQDSGPRTVRNWSYLSGVNTVLKTAAGGLDAAKQRWPWLLDVGGKGEFRVTVLTELGRTWWLASMRSADDAATDADTVRCADLIMEMVSSGQIRTAREAAAWLRQHRLQHLGKPSVASSAALARIIATAIDGYRAEHPDATADMVKEALSGLAELMDLLRKPFPE